MTVREKVENMLIEQGLFVQQAKKIMDISIPKINALSDDYTITWDSYWLDYEEEMYNFLFSLVKPEVLKWIDEHCSKAWFRDSFVD